MTLPKIVCEVLRGITVIGFLCVAQEEQPLAAATYYASPSGSGTTCSLASPCSVDSGINKMAAGDTLELIAGTYRVDQYYIGLGGNQALNCSVGSPCIIQPKGYTGPGTGDTVFIDGANPSAVWTQCTGTAGNCCGITTPASTSCSIFWSHTGSGDTVQAIGAQKPDGLPTYRVLSGSDLTNAHSVYNGSVCSTTSWMACEFSYDCPSGQTCTGNSAEIDTFTSGGRIFIRMPTTASNPNSLGYYVFNNGDGNGFFVGGNTHYLTIRGFNFRCHESSAVLVTEFGGSRPGNITVTDNRIYYADAAFSSGPDYGMVVYRSDDVTFSSNNIGYTISEGIHTQARTDGVATVYTLSGNWIHNQADPRIYGPGSHGTASGVIMTDDYAGGGNYAGTVFENNLIERQRMRGEFTGGNPRGLILENNVSGVIVRNNIFYQPDAECLKHDTSVVNSNHQIYNNLFVECGVNPGAAGGGGPGIYSDGDGTFSSNVYYNNTFINCKAGGMRLANNPTVSGAVIRNNIFYDTNFKLLISWPKAATFTHNILFPGGTGDSGTVVSLNGTSYVCSTLGPLATRGVCDDPAVVLSAGPYNAHLQSVSPAKDRGTATGMPAGRTADINNTLASTHGLPSYADNHAIQGGTWDIGADEYFETRLELLTDGGFDTGVLTAQFTTVPAVCDCPTPAAGIDTTSPPGPQAGGYFASATYAVCADPAISCQALKLTLSGLTVGRQYTFSGYWSAPYTGTTLYLFQNGATSSNLLCFFTDTAIAGTNPIRNTVIPGCVIHRDTPTAANTWSQFSAIFTAESTSHIFYIYGDAVSGPANLGVQVDTLSVRSSN